MNGVVEQWRTAALAVFQRPFVAGDLDTRHCRFAECHNRSFQPAHDN
ncbi:hypothetical protein [uncultured Hoeflea sp.]|nr:hypothetical protein [uncultured Hoeflea sp.]